MHYWSYLVLTATCAVLIASTVFAVARLTDDGPTRLLVVWPIALLMGSATYASAAASNAAHRRR